MREIVKTALEWGQVAEFYEESDERNFKTAGNHNCSSKTVRKSTQLISYALTKFFSRRKVEINLYANYHYRYSIYSKY
jgi:hypothetical protein